MPKPVEHIYIYNTHENTFALGAMNVPATRHAEGTIPELLEIARRRGFFTNRSLCGAADLPCTLVFGAADCPTRPEGEKIT